MMTVISVLMMLNGACYFAVVFFLLSVPFIIIKNRLKSLFFCYLKYMAPISKTPLRLRIKTDMSCALLA
ncbi:hypothetical protein MCZ47_09295 [Bacillus altitudinis]|uniref:hypothetical protein n=1 Tax=Bacillus altitudinis TaxID=293387 RepID=UPI000C249DD3|nr:hypothetical protein [Bacillus altitudinis]MCY7450453.1 hypothetical protein [Bacillus altitudinis]PJI13669.1 hypothetical protein CTV96_00885 [Bacillus altitudinis]PKQ87010.1 hypothetical protein CTV98_002470 [Bacillus altitudinis]